MYIEELKFYTEKLKVILNSNPDLSYTWNENSPCASQIFYHTFQAIKYWLGELILEIPSHRNRDDEFEETHSLIKIQEALSECEMLISKYQNAEVDNQKSINVLTQNNPSPEKIWTVLDGLIHITAHTAEHYGQLKYLAK